MRRCLGIVCLSSLLAGCILPKDRHVDVDFGTTLASKFVHRGQTLVNQPVLQPELRITSPTADGGGMRMQVDANMDLRNNTGAAWFPDGHAGRFTQIEFVGAYSRTVGIFDLEAGVHSYNLPNGLEFPLGERGGTTEVFLRAATHFLEADQYLMAHYDFDEVRGSYLRAGLAEDFDLGGGFSLNLDGSLGYVSEAQAAWMYGLGESGLADLRGTATVEYLVDERTVLSLSLNGSSIVDKTLRRWFVNDLDFDADPIWISIGVVWRL